MNVCEPSFRGHCFFLAVIIMPWEGEGDPWGVGVGGGVWEVTNHLLGCLGSPRKKERPPGMDSKFQLHRGKKSKKEQNQKPNLIRIRVGVRIRGSGFGFVVFLILSAYHQKSYPEELS